MFAVPLALLSLSSLFALSHAFDRSQVFKNTAAVVTDNSAEASKQGFTNAWPLIGEYTVTVYIQGQPFQVVIDSGSSDLWIFNSEKLPLDGLIDTGHNQSDDYADGTHIDGPIVLANVSLGEFTVQAQAFINSGSGSAELNTSADGILGVSSPFSSQILGSLYNSSYNGWPLLSNLFNNHPEKEPYTTFYLTRSFEGVNQGGAFTISELVADYAAITDAPQLPVVSRDSFLTFMDGMYVNGEIFAGHSFGVNGTGATATPNANQTLAVLDTGTSLMTAPPYYVDAIFKNIPGATWDSAANTYSVPCSTKLNISLVFNGIEYPIHPIDAVAMNVSTDGSVNCFGALTYGKSVDGCDFILGSSFLRNTYTLFHWGNWTKSRTSQPYMQLLSLTDTDEAWAEFDAMNFQRMGESEWQVIEQNAGTIFPKTASQSVTYSLTSPSATGSWASATTAPAAWSSPASSASATVPAPARVGAALAEASDSTSVPVDFSALKRNSYIIMGLVGGVLVLLLGILTKLVSNGRNQQYRAVPNIVRPPMHFSDKPYEPESEAFSTPYDDPARQH